MITYKYPFYPRKSDNKFFIGIMWEGESFIQRREKKTLKIFCLLDRPGIKHQTTVLSPSLSCGHSKKLNTLAWMQ